MIEKEKKIKDEFGIDSEAQAVQEYTGLNRDFMAANYPLIADEIISKLALNKSVILDIGTGLGSLALEFAKRLPESKIYGLDISSEMLDQAKDNARKAGIVNAEFMLCDANNIKFDDGFFDLAVSFGVLHHVSNVNKVFSEIKRVLNPSGSAFIYDLKGDAPEFVVTEIANEMSELQKRAFLDSVKEALNVSDLETIMKGLGVSEFRLVEPVFSRRTLIKNKDMLRKAVFMGGRFNTILIEASFRK